MENQEPEKKEYQGEVIVDEVIEGPTISTLHEHFYENAGINENGLLDVVCLACGHGMQVDPQTIITDGKITTPRV